jgi:hypothetical protein
VSLFCLELLDERDLLDARDLLDELLPLLDDFDLLLDDRRPLPDLLEVDLLEDRVLLDLDLEPWLAMSPPGG